MKIAPRARWYVLVLQFSPLVAGALLAFVLLAVPAGLRAQIDTAREQQAIAVATGAATADAYDEALYAEQWLVAMRNYDRMGDSPFAMAWQQVQVFLALRQQALLGSAGLLLVMAIVASPAAFVVERRRITQALVLEEMERVQQDAHDKVYNRLSALSKRVELASKSISAEADRSLDGVAEDIRDTVTDLQEILGDARQRTASITGKDPLRSQLESVAREQAARLGITVNLTVVDSLPPLSGQTGWDLQCVLEEAINNAVEHGDSTHVVASVTADGETLTMRVSDNGSGMPATNLDDLPEEHIGLRSMASRAERHGGTFAARSGTGGATVEVRIPFDGEPLL